MAGEWTTLDMYPEGSAVWLMLTCNTAMQAMNVSSLPTEEEGALRIEVPTVMQQARAMRGNDVSLGPKLMQQRIDEAKFNLLLFAAFPDSAKTTMDEDTARRISTMSAATNAYYHVHRNKDVLDKFSELSSGSPAYNRRELLTETSVSHDIASVKPGDGIPDNLRTGGLIIETREE